MILDQVTLEDYGLYAGKQSINLAPPERDKPIVLIGGLNGSGKTTFLDALQLSFFGPHATISSRGSLGYGEYLLRSIHKKSKRDTARIQVKFRRTVEGEEERYTLNRSWARVNGQCKERLEITKNNIPVPTLAKNWATQVEEFFPANIANLFLFDGEQIETYASLDKSPILIRGAIQNLLGLDIVDQLEKDLVVYERRKRSEEKKDDTHKAIESLQAELEQLRMRIDSQKQELAALRTHKIDRIARELEDAQQEYKRLGGTLYDRREEIEAQWADARQRISESELRMREFVAGAAPLNIVRKLLEFINLRDRKEEDARRALHVYEALRLRDSETIGKLRGLSVNEQAIEEIANYFNDDRTARKKVGKTKTILNLPGDARTDFYGLLKDGIRELKLEAENLHKEHQDILSQAREIELELNNIPNSDTIANIVDRRQQLQESLISHKANEASLSDEIDRLVGELERKNQKLSRLLEADVKRRTYSEDRSRILFHSNKVRKTLSEFRTAVVRRHVSRIEHLVLESYQQLLRKSSLVTRLAIDPKDFTLTLVDRDGHALKAERLSAGERQLLATALLWGLARASGRPLPTAIDTPLGRLDSGHRKFLVERYLPFASHQVILLSTDEEIMDEYLQILAPWIGRTYYLNYDDKLGETQVAPGYFESREAA